jgi:hypothetical protein
MAKLYKDKNNSTNRKQARRRARRAQELYDRFEDAKRQEIAKNSKKREVSLSKELAED